MPNLGFDTAEGDVLFVGIVVAEYLVESVELGGITSGGAGAVSFDKIDGCG